MTTNTLNIALYVANERQEGTGISIGILKVTGHIKMSAKSYSNVGLTKKLQCYMAILGGYLKIRQCNKTQAL